VVIFVQNNEVPHIASYETHQRPQEISIVIPKRLLQQYLPFPDFGDRHASPRFHFTWRRGGGVAACGICTAAWANAGDRGKQVMAAVHESPFLAEPDLSVQPDDVSFRG
jgi:hypothetical protein